MHTNIKSEMRSFKSNENIHKKEGKYFSRFTVQFPSIPIAMHR